MKKYLATFRKYGSAQPISVQFSSNGVGEAIADMCAAAGVTGTSSIEEFDILEDHGGDKYTRVAVKFKKEDREKMLRGNGTPKANVSKPEPREEEATPIDEFHYIPYVLEAA